jgi:hypothetical protein
MERGEVAAVKAQLRAAGKLVGSDERPVLDGWDLYGPNLEQALLSPPGDCHCGAPARVMVAYSNGSMGSEHVPVTRCFRLGRAMVILADFHGYCRVVLAGL